MLKILRLGTAVLSTCPGYLVTGISGRKDTTLLKTIPKSDRITSGRRDEYFSSQDASCESPLKTGHYRK